eukprot:COSAG05_NODE_584_length_8527_cov_46.366279_10_plen_372_part_00
MACENRKQMVAWVARQQAPGQWGTWVVPRAKVGRMETGRAATAASGVQQQQARPTREVIYQIFRACDRDGDGVLSRREYAFFCARTERRDLDDARWASHCQALGVQPAAGIPLASFVRLYTAEFPRHYRQASTDLDNIMGTRPSSKIRQAEPGRAATAAATARRRAVRRSGVGSFEVLRGLPKQSTAHQLLRQLARVAAPILSRRGWYVGKLCEFLPNSPSLEGMNVNGGEQIKLRLREDRRNSAFMDFPSLLLNFLHELTHIEASVHDANFFNILAELVDTASRSGYPEVHRRYIQQRALAWTCSGGCCSGGGGGGASSLSRPMLRQLLGREPAVDTGSSGWGVEQHGDRRATTAVSFPHATVGGLWANR